MKVGDEEVDILVTEDGVRLGGSRGGSTGTQILREAVQAGVTIEDIARGFAALIGRRAAFDLDSNVKAEYLAEAREVLRNAMRYATERNRSDNDRGTGRTSRAIAGAPKNSIYVWVNSDTSYPEELAVRLGRRDLKIVSPGWFDYPWSTAEYYAGIVVDHATALNKRQEEVYLKTLSKMRKEAENA